MQRLLGAILATLFLMSPISPARADDKDPNAILDKAIKAVGGEEKLKKAEVITWKSKGTITFGGDNKNEFKLHATAQGIDRSRREIEGEFGGEARKFVVVLSGDKGWRKFGDEPMEMDDDALANEKRTLYLEILSTRLVPLKDKGFKLEPAAEEKVDGKPAAGIKITGPDKKEFTIYFDNASGLPVKTVAKVIGFNGDEHNQETTFKDYKDFDGIKKATKIEVKHDGMEFITSEITEFKVLDKVDPKSFSQPE